MLLRFFSFCSFVINTSLRSAYQQFLTFTLLFWWAQYLWQFAVAVSVLIVMVIAVQFLWAPVQCRSVTATAYNFTLSLKIYGLDHLISLSTYLALHAHSLLSTTYTKSSHFLPTFKRSNVRWHRRANVQFDWHFTATGHIYRLGLRN